MKRAFLASLAALAVCALVVGIATDVSAHKYKKLRSKLNEPGAVASAERVRSMDDCMKYSANHVSKGHSTDSSLFKGQFGQPTSVNGAISTYKYDSYTDIMLDCSRRLCSCRCVGRY